MDTLSTLPANKVVIPDAFGQAFERTQHGYQWMTSSLLLVSVFYCIIEPSWYTTLFALGLIVTEVVNVVANNNTFPQGERPSFIENWWPHKIQGIGYVGGFLIVYFYHKLDLIRKAELESVKKGRSYAHQKQANRALRSIAAVILLLIFFVIFELTFPPDTMQRHIIALCFIIGLVTGILFGAIGSNFTKQPPFNAEPTPSRYRQNQTCRAYIDGVMVGKIH